MKWNHPLFSALQFLQVVFFVMGGFICLVLPFAPELKIKLANVILFQDKAFFLVGGCLAAIGFILGITNYYFQRSRSLEVGMEPAFSIEPQVIGNLVQSYLQKKFPEQTIHAEASISSESGIELVLNNYKLPDADLKKHLSEIELEIGDLLYRTIGYTKKFKVTFLD